MDNYVGKMTRKIHGGSSHNWFISTHWTDLLGKNKQTLGGVVFLVVLPAPGRNIIMFAWSVRLLVAKSSFCNSGHSLVIWPPRNIPMACPVPGRKISFVKMAHLLHENSEF